MKFRLSFSSSRRRTLVLHLLLVVSLLLAQAAAYAHATAHLKPSNGDVGGQPTQLCGECLAGAPLLGGAGAPHVPSIAPVAAAVTPIPILVCAPVEHRSHYAFRSRAPPPSL